MAEFEKTILDFLLGKAGCKEMETHINERGLACISQYAEANSLGFALASALDKKNCRVQEIKKSLAEKNRAHFQRLALARQAQAAFEKRNCKTILMKSFFPFPYLDQDLDFVAVESFEKCSKALLEANFSVQKSRSYLREPKKRFYSRQGSNFSIHLHSAFSWNGIEYLNKEKVWQNTEYKKIQGTAFNTPSPTHRFLITAAHAMFENKCIYTADLLNITLLSNSGKLNRQQLSKEAKEFNWGKALESFEVQANKLQNQNFPKILFPFILQDTFSSSFQKLFKDIAALKLKQMPRQLFSYSLVDFLLQRKAKKLREAVVQRCS